MEKQKGYVNRCGAHSHIQGLGIAKSTDTATTTVLYSGDGFIGQERARRAALVVHAIVKKGKLSGRIVIISGAPGTGKTALAIGLAKSLGNEVPFTSMTSSEIYSMGVSRTEVLTQALRRAISVVIKEETEVIEGEVAEMAIECAADGSRKGTMTLRTKDMESLYTLGPKLIIEMEKQNIIAGDIISLSTSSGQVRKLGRAIARSGDYDACSADQNFMQTPSGEIQKIRQQTHTVSVHDIDVINSRADGFTALFAGNTGEISPEVRAQVDRKLTEWVYEGKANMIPGVLFIDECHLLDAQSYAYLNKALETQNAPLLILATNRGIVPIRGTNQLSPHGIPADFLDRALIIPTEPYSRDDSRGIIIQRAEADKVSLSVECVELLVSLAMKTNLRYVLNLISFADLRAKKRESNTITLEDIERCSTLFYDVKRSTAHLQENTELYLH